MGKLIFLDIDGTIRDFDGYIPDSAVEAIRGARMNGHKVCISSGRPYFQTGGIRSIGFDGIISGSGSYVEYKGECVCHKSFSLLSYIALCEYLLKNHCILEMQTYKQSFILKDQVQDYITMGRQLHEAIGVEEQGQTELPEIIDSAMKLTEVEKINFFNRGFSHEELQNKWSSQLYVVPLSISNFEDWGGEISPLSVNKAEGIKNIKSVVTEEENSAPEIIAVGDSENDIEMLRMADIGVAMGNATKKTKDTADVITASLREDGIYKAFELLQLI